MNKEMVLNKVIRLTEENCLSWAETVEYFKELVHGYSDEEANLDTERVDFGADYISFYVVDEEAFELVMEDVGRYCSETFK